MRGAIPTFRAFRYATFGTIQSSSMDLDSALPRDIVDRVVVVDGGSPDGTAEVARRAGAEVITVGRGYGRACQAGAQAAEDPTGRSSVLSAGASP